MVKIDDLLGYFRRKFLDQMLDDLAFWRSSKRSLHEDDADEPTRVIRDYEKHDA